MIQTEQPVSINPGTLWTEPPSERVTSVYIHSPFIVILDWLQAFSDNNARKRIRSSLWFIALSSALYDKYASAKLYIKAELGNNVPKKFRVVVQLLLSDSCPILIFYLCNNHSPTLFFMATSFGFQLVTSPNKKGLYPVVLRITQDRKQKKVDTELLKKVLKKLDVSGIRIDHTNGW